MAHLIRLRAALIYSHTTHGADHRIADAIEGLIAGQTEGLEDDDDDPTTVLRVSWSRPANSTWTAQRV